MQPIVLPEGSTFVSVQKYGSSAFTLTGKLLARDAGGSEKAYFLKVAFGEKGRIMLRGEFESSKVIHQLMPDFIPQPFGSGRYTAPEDPPTYFYISEFVDMDVISDVDPPEFTRRLAQMHKSSVSPTGKFGFHVTTCDGTTPQPVDWEESWAVFYRKMFLSICKIDLERNGQPAEFRLAVKQVSEKVTPRLLEPLQANGRQIKPSIIHGDLWEGNKGINCATGDSMLFDAGSYYAHNEIELGHWRCEFSSAFRDEVYTRRYLEHYPAAEPADEFDDRNRLYSLRSAMNYAAGHPESGVRKTVYNNMCYLCEKYAPIEGIDKYDPSIDPALTGARIVPHSAEDLV
ncbi:Fructosamine kinase-domain-containing protein [Coniochaeta sp. 2T2.1]|nr:Fructosamine kinase-domain-containing protein [Coniochaeta sp. 2T2.1]